MKIESLKDLQKVIQLCRKLGVQSIKVDSIEFHLGDLPKTAQKLKTIPNIDQITKNISSPYTPGGINEETKIVAEIADIDTDDLSADQLLFYSARPESHEQGQQ